MSVLSIGYQQVLFPYKVAGLSTHTTVLAYQTLLTYMTSDWGTRLAVHLMPLNPTRCISPAIKHTGILISPHQTARMSAGLPSPIPPSSSATVLLAIPEIVLHMLHHLSPSKFSDTSVRTLVSCSQASRALRHVVRIESLWKGHYIARYGVYGGGLDKTSTLSYFTHF